MYRSLAGALGYHLPFAKSKLNKATSSPDFDVQDIKGIE